MGHESDKNEHYYTRQPKSRLKLGLIRTHLRGRFFEFLTSSSVFSKGRIDAGTQLLIETMVLPEKGDILDLGCGYGPLGIVVAALNPSLHVLMVDINERATWLARKNAKLNNVGVEIRQGFLYEPIGEMKFDAILSNPPIRAGMGTVLPIIRGAAEHLYKDGLLQLVVRSKTGGKRLSNELEKTFGNAKVLARKSGYRVLLSKKP